ncbi:MAG: hypothetical protein NTNFB02_10350 [Nitrospira sp.]
MTVRELIQAYQAADTPRQRDEDRLAWWWIEQLGDCPAPALTTEQIQQHIQTPIHRRRSPWTSNFYLRFLRRVCAWAVQRSILLADPCATIPLPKDRPVTLRVLTEDEEGRLCEELGQPYALWVRVAIQTGLEQSVQFAVQWQDVHLERAWCQIARPHPRKVPLSAEAVLILRELQQIHPPSVWVFPDLRDPTRPANIHSFYVRRWETALRRAGIPRCAWKDLRHTCGVRLAKQGMRPAEIAARLGQRELRQCYYYRAWQPGTPYVARHAVRKNGLVFADLAARQLQQLLTRDHRSAPLTFHELCHLYAVHQLRHRPSRPQFDRIFRQSFQHWSGRPAESVTRKEIRAWHASLASRPSHANKALTFLRSAYNLASDFELITCANPTLRIKRYPSAPRERFLVLDETKRFLDGLQYLPLKQRAYLLTLFLTGARKSEVRTMQWHEIDFQTRLWRKPTTKTGVSHLVPVPVQAIEMLQQLPRNSPWIFRGTKGRPWSAQTVDTFWHVFRRRWKLEDIRLHDLRRTCASYLAISGENLPTIQNVLNHRNLTHTSIYARLNVKAVDRALQRQADRLFGIGQNEISIREMHPMIIDRSGTEGERVSHGQ